MSNKTKVIISIVLLASSFAAGRFSLPAKIVEKEVVKYQDRVVEKKVYVKDTNTKKNVVTVRLVTIKPDGTRTIETKTFDKSDIEITQKDNTNIADNTKVDSETDKLTVYDKGSFLVSAGIKANLTSSAGWAYGILVDKRAIGPFHLGAFGFTDATFGMTLGVGF